MPNTTPLGIGDVPYDQHSTTKTNVIKQSVAITKGYIYTPDGEGRLIVPVSTTSVADLTKGIFQARESVTAPSAEDADKVQGLVPKSRIILKGAANLVEGQEVELSSSGSTTTQDKCMAAASPRTKGFLGRIFEIYTKNTDGTNKQKTADNDLVVIELEA
jgi:hypothetical protein